MSTTLDSTLTQLRSAEENTLAEYAAMVAALADGTAVPGNVAELLDRAGRTSIDLQRDVQNLQSRQHLERAAAREREAQRESDALDAALHAFAAPLKKQIDALWEQIKAKRDETERLKGALRTEVVEGILARGELLRSARQG